MIKFLRNNCNWYILLMLLYEVLRMLGENVPGYIALLRTFTAAMIVGWSVFHFAWALSRPPLPLYLKGLVALVILLGIYGVVLSFSDVVLVVREDGVNRLVRNDTYLKQICLSLLPIFSFYIFTRQGKLTEQLLRGWFIPIIAVFTWSFIWNSATLKYETGAENITNNISYRFTYLMPLCVFVWRRNGARFVWLFFCLVMTIIGFKRGAMITGALCFLTFTAVALHYSSFKQKAGVVLLLIVAVIGSVYFLNNTLETNAYAAHRFESMLEGDMGHREDLNANFWDYFKERATPMQQLFGNGANSTLLIYDNYAHNDWLELLTDQGLLGILVYLCYFACMAISILRCRGSEVYIPFLMMGITLLLPTLFSMGYSQMNVANTTLMGYIAARYGVYNTSSSKKERSRLLST